MSIKTSVQTIGLGKAYDYKDRQSRLPQVVSILEKFVPAGSAMDAQINGVKDILTDPNDTWNKFVMGLWPDIDNEVRRSIFKNFVINGSFLESEIHDKLEQEHGCNIPWTMLIDPTSACNLNCTGCWAAEYGNKLNLPFEALDDIIRQGKELGILFFLYSGGESLVRKADIIRLWEKHNDCQFSAFTNATLIDQAFADEMLRVKNFIPSISMEGFEADTDFRRGQPFNGNHLRPCPLLNNPEKLRSMVHASGAHSTDMESPEDIDKLSAKCDGPAERWAVVADDLWKCSGHCAGCQGSK